MVSEIKEEVKKMSKQTKIIIVLSIVLLAFACFNGYGEFNKYKDKKLQEMRIEGRIETLQEIINLATACREIQIPVNTGTEDERVIQLKNIACN